MEVWAISGCWAGSRLMLTPMPTMAQVAAFGAMPVSMRMPAILRPPTRMSLGHLIVGDKAASSRSMRAVARAAAMFM